MISDSGKGSVDYRSPQREFYKALKQVLTFAQ